MGWWKDRVVFLTGASSGIGLAMATQMAAQGAKVGLAARRKDRLEQAERTIREHGGQALAVECDVTSDESVARAVAEVRAAFGPVLVAIANAGFGVVGRLERLGMDDFRRQFETNVFGVLRTAWACLDDLKATRGSLVLVGSVAAYVPGPGSSPYAASKAAVRSLGESLWAEMAPEGITVTTLHPGYVRSEIRHVDNQGRLHPDSRDPIPSWLVVPTDRAAREMVRAIARRRREVIVTGHGKAIVALSRLAPCLVAQAMKGRRRPGRRNPPEV